MLIIDARATPSIYDKGWVSSSTWSHIFPPNCLASITANAGYQAEFHASFVGLDIEEKARWTEEQIRESLGDLCNKLSLLKFHLNDTSPIDAPNQDAATADLRIVAQGSDAEMFDFLNPQSFGRKTMDCILESAPVDTPDPWAARVTDRSWYRVSP